MNKSIKLLVDIHFGIWSHLKDFRLLWSLRSLYDRFWSLIGRLLLYRLWFRLRSALMLLFTTWFALTFAKDFFNNALLIATHDSRVRVHVPNVVALA